MMNLFSVIFLLTISAALSNADPCQTAEVRKADLRSSTNLYDPAQTTTRFCDITLAEGWYRFQVNLVDADMPTTAPAFGSCNTVFPVYLDGQLPKGAGTEVNLNACVLSPVAVCTNPIAVKVRNCGTYNVYFLKPVKSCPTAYCFDTATQPCPAGQSSETGLQPGCSADFPVINAAPVVEPVLGLSVTNPILQDLRFRCSAAGLDPSHLYDVIWFVNDVEVRRFTRLTFAGLPKSAELLEADWTDKFRMGMNVKCAIRARSSATGTPSPEHQGPVFFAGIKVVGETAIELNEGEERKVQFTATVPIPCFVGFNSCDLQLRVQKIGNTCAGDISDCKISIKYQDWNAIHTFTVKGTYNGLYGDQVAQLILKAQSNIPGLVTVWDKLETAPIQVNIHDTDTQVAGSRCTVFNDPHFLTFDNKRFDVHQHGEFVLYKHKTLPYEVRGFFQHCGGGSIAHCVCGAAVRSGSQYFVWSRCQDNIYDGTSQTSRINVYGCTSRQLSVTTDNNGRNYKIRLPSGMVVTVDTVSRSIMIVPSAADIQQSEGLCGNFNGDPDDEFIDPTGEQYSNDCERYLFGSPSVFCMVPTYSKTWKISDSVDSFYNGLIVNNLGPALTAHCRCADADPGNGEDPVISCDNTPRPGCEAGLSPNDVTDQYCTQLSKRRRKRAAPGTSEPIAIFPLEPLNPTPVMNGNNVWMNGWTKQKAEEHCRRVFGTSKSVQACKAVPNLKENMMVDSCVADIALTGTTEWTATTLEAHKVQCLSEAAKNTSLWGDNSGNQQTVLQNILMNSCPSDCSGIQNGVCNQGKCVCKGQWIGPDCSVNSLRPPIVKQRAELCDLSQSDCLEVVVRGENFVKSNSLTCRFIQVKVTKRTRLTGIRFTTPAVYRHSSEIVCKIDDIRYPVTSGQGYHVSVSNNNKTFSDSKTVISYNSECFDCAVSVNRGRGSCEHQKNFCYVSNECVAVGAMSVSGELCNITGTKEYWTPWYTREDSVGGPGEQHYIPLDCLQNTPTRTGVRRKSTIGNVLNGNTRTRTNFTVLGDLVESGLPFGFLCRDAVQPDGRCNDYEARFYCERLEFQ